MKKTLSSPEEHRQNKEKGQVLVEFAILVIVFALMAISAALFLKHFSVFGRWLLNAVGVGYP